MSEDRDRQSDDEIRAHLDGSAATAVQAWIDAVFRHGRWDLALLLMSPDGRETFVRDYVADYADPPIALEDQEEIVTALVGIDVEHPHWDPFANVMLLAHITSWGDLANNLAIASRPRPYDLETEKIILLDYRNVQAPPIEIEGEEVGRMVSTPHAVAVEFAVVHSDGRAQISGWVGGPDFPVHRP